VLVVTDLTPDNWDEFVVNSDKPSFVKFYAPWCGHCKKLKPTWDDLAEHFDTKDKSVLIGDVDCTGTAQALCSKYNIKGYPTLKSFWKNIRKDYEGERTYDALLKFASALGPMCGLNSRSSCSSEQLENINSWSKNTTDSLEHRKSEIESVIKNLEIKHEDFVHSLREQFQHSEKELQKEKEAYDFEMSIIDSLVKGASVKDEM